MTGIEIKIDQSSNSVILCSQARRTAFFFSVHYLHIPCDKRIFVLMFRFADTSYIHYTLRL